MPAANTRMIRENLGLDFAALSVRMYSDPPSSLRGFLIENLPLELRSVTRRAIREKSVSVSWMTTVWLLTPPAMLTLATHPSPFPRQRIVVVFALAGAAPM